MWARLYVFAGCMLLVGLYALRLFVVEGQDPFAVDYAGVLMNIGAAVLAVLVVYTLIGTKIYVSEYNRSQRRLGNYMDLIKLLNDMSGTGAVPTVGTGSVPVVSEFEQGEPERGTDLYYAGNDSKLL